MPLGLTRKTWPFALIWPAMVDDVVPVTRLRMAAAELGWTKLTLALVPTEKLFQSTMAFEDPWLIVSVLSAGAPILTWPEATVPPCGRTACASAPAVIVARSAHASRSALLGCRLPNALVSRLRI